MYEAYDVNVDHERYTNSGTTHQSLMLYSVILVLCGKLELFVLNIAWVGWIWYISDIKYQ